MSRLLILAVLFMSGCYIYVPYNPQTGSVSQSDPQEIAPPITQGALHPVQGQVPVVVVQESPRHVVNRPRSRYRTYHPPRRHHHSHTPQRTHVHHPRPVRIHVRPAPRPHRARPAPAHRIVRRNAPPPRPTKVHRAPARRTRPVRHAIRPTPVRVRARPANRRRVRGRGNGRTPVRHVRRRRR